MASHNTALKNAGLLYSRTITLDAYILGPDVSIEDSMHCVAGINSYVLWTITNHTERLNDSNHFDSAGNESKNDVHRNGQFASVTIDVPQRYRRMLEVRLLTPRKIKSLADESKHDTRDNHTDQKSIENTAENDHSGLTIDIAPGEQAILQWTFLAHEQHYIKEDESRFLQDSNDLFSLNKNILNDEKCATRQVIDGICDSLHRSSQNKIATKKHFAICIPLTIRRSCTEGCNNVNDCLLRDEIFINVICKGHAVLAPRYIDFGDHVKLRDAHMRSFALINDSDLPVDYSFECAESKTKSDMKIFSRTKIRLNHVLNASGSKCSLKAFSIDKPQGRIAPHSLTQLTVTICLQDYGMVSIPLNCTIIPADSSTEGPSSTMSTLNMLVIAACHVPRVQIVDVRTADFSEDQSALWRQLSLDSVNDELMQPLTYAELVYDGAASTASQLQQQLKLSSFDCDLGVGQLHSESVFYFELQNPTLITVSWQLWLPTDAEIELPIWTHNDHLSAEQRYYQTIIANKLFEFSERSGRLQAAERCIIELRYRHFAIGCHKLPVILHVHGGKSVIIRLTGLTVEDIPEKVFFSSSKTIGASSDSVLELMPQPIGLREQEVPIQTLRLINRSNKCLSFSIDRLSFEECIAANWRFPVFQCLKSSGMIQPRKAIYVPLTFRPLEAKEYLIRLRIVINGTTEQYIVLKAIGLPGNVLPVWPQKTSQPLFQTLLLPDQPAVLSREQLDFGRIATSTIRHRSVLLTNLSNHHATFRWRTFGNSSQAVTDSLYVQLWQSVRKEERSNMEEATAMLLAEPAVGTIAPQSSVLIKFTLLPGEQPIVLQRIVYCELNFDREESASLKPINHDPKSSSSGNLRYIEGRYHSPEPANRHPVSSSKPKFALNQQHQWETKQREAIQQTVSKRAINTKAANGTVSHAIAIQDVRVVPQKWQQQPPIGTETLFHRVSKMLSNDEAAGSEAPGSVDFATMESSLEQLGHDNDRSLWFAASSKPLRHTRTPKSSFILHTAISAIVHLSDAPSSESEITQLDAGFFFHSSDTDNVVEALHNKRIQRLLCDVEEESMLSFAQLESGCMIESTSMASGSTSLQRALQQPIKAQIFEYCIVQSIYSALKEHLKG